MITKPRPCSRSKAVWVAALAVAPMLMGALPFKLPVKLPAWLGQPDNDRAPWEWREPTRRKVPGAAPSARGVYQPMFVTRLTAQDRSHRNILEAVTQGSAWNRRELAAPVMDPSTGLVLVGTSDQRFHAVSVKTGAPVWQKTLDGRVSSQPVLDGEHVIFGADDARIYALRTSTGYADWVWHTDAEVTAPVTVFGRNVYAHTALDTVTCVDRVTGAFRWQARHPLPVGINLLGEGATAAGMVLRRNDPPMEAVFVGHADGTVSALDGLDGHTLWNVSIGRGDDFLDVDADVFYQDGLVYAAGFHGGLFALDPISGATIWSRPDVDGVNRMSLTANTLVVAGPRYVAALDRADGAQRWKFTFATGGASRPVVHRGRVLVATDHVGLYVLDMTDGRPLQYYGGFPGVTGAPAPYRDMVFMLSNAGGLHALSERYSGVMRARGGSW